MRVNCINIYNDRTKQYEDKHHRLTVGKEYIVLEIGIYQNKILYRLVGDGTDQSPTLHKATHFEIVSGRISTNWEICQSSSGTLMVGPKAWNNIGFWEDCFNRDPKALETYKREARIIYEEEIIVTITAENRARYF